MGLAARIIERSGISTAILSSIPELSVSVGAPRVIGIGYPGSVPLGLPGDANGQRAVLRSSLETAAAIRKPGERADLRFDWPAGVRLPRPLKPPPIAMAIVRRPWLFLKLLNGEIP